MKLDAIVSRRLERCWIMGPFFARDGNAQTMRSIA
jgi:hypothetical protein